MVGEVLLAGHENYANLAAGSYLRLTKFKAGASGIANQMKMRLAYQSGSVVMGIYADADGSPGGLLTTSGSFSPSAVDVDVAVPPVSIVADTFYWLACITSANLYYGSVSPNYGGLAKYGTFEFVLPDPAGAGFESRSYSVAISCWGELATGGAGRLIGTGNSRLIGGRSPLIGGRSPLIG